MSHHAPVNQRVVMTVMQRLPAGDVFQERRGIKKAVDGRFSRSVTHLCFTWR